MDNFGIFALPFTNNRTEAAIFQFLLYIFIRYLNSKSQYEENVGHVYCINKISMGSSSTGVLPILTRERCLVNCPP